MNSDHIANVVKKIENWYTFLVEWCNAEDYGRTNMFRTLGLVSLLTLALAVPSQEAAAQDPLGGAILGGAAGAIIGGVAGGGRGAAIGAGIGAVTGAAIAAEGQRRRGGYYYWRNGCYIQRPDGVWI